MTWGLITSLVLIFFIKLILSCPPRKLADWFLSKFEVHPKLNDEDVTITYQDKRLECEDKQEFISNFNEGNFLQKYNIFPGNEKYYLNPENNISPYIIETNKGNKEIRLMVYRYHDHVDVVKQYPKKVVAYSLHSDGLQIPSL